MPIPSTLVAYLVLGLGIASQLQFIRILGFVMESLYCYLLYIQIFVHFKSILMTDRMQRSLQHWMRSFEKIVWSTLTADSEHCTYQRGAEYKRPARTAIGLQSASQTNRAADKSCIALHQAMCLEDHRR